jgi:hypothetical protein
MAEAAMSLNVTAVREEDNLIGSKKEKNVEFKTRRLTGSALEILICWLISLIVFITASIYSSVSGGNAGMEAGFAGILSFLLSVTSFGLSVEELSKKPEHRVFDIIMLIMSGSMAVFIFALYLMGTVV